MDLQEAKDTVVTFINDRFDGDDELVLIDSEIIETDFGWVFCYDSKRFIESGELIHALAGNAPIIFDNRDETIHVTGTSKGVSYYIGEHIKNYEPDVK